MACKSPSHVWNGHETRGAQATSRMNTRLAVLNQKWIHIKPLGVLTERIELDPEGGISSGYLTSVYM